MNVKIATAIDEVVDEFARNQKMFTAFDVTKKLRSKNLICFHSEVKKHVHDSFALYHDFAMSYKKTSISLDLDGIIKQAILYHVDIADTSTYNPHEIDSPAVIKKIDGKKVDKRGRLLIPSQYIKDAGWKRNTLTKVAFDSFGTVMITRVNSALSHTDYSYFVDKDCNIRLSHRILNSLGLSKYKTFEFESFSLGIVITGI